MKFLRTKIGMTLLAIIVASCLFMLGAYVLGGPNFVSDLLGSVVTPLQRGVGAAADAVTDFFGYFHRYDELKAENEALRAKLTEYEHAQLDYDLAISENELLRDMLKLNRRHKDFVCEPCKVVSASGGQYRSSFTIDRGSLAGIEVGDSVVTNEGLVGYVSEVGLSYAQVLTVLDVSVKVGATVSRTREAVVAEGDLTLLGEGKFKLSYLKNDADVKPGDLVETSGYGGMYPKGLLLGRVLEFKPEAHGISSYAVLEPVVPLNELRSVFVVKDFTIVD
ncbi:MAG: rod shape-determining protein MreC [Clostridium sp. SCN 57-10]|nr:MAG: rod shape-determining protein MreC [Clostridium sp. SCN 57-10]